MHCIDHNLHGMRFDRCNVDNTVKLLNVRSHHVEHCVRRLYTYDGSRRPAVENISQMALDLSNLTWSSRSAS